MRKLKVQLPPMHMGGQYQAFNDDARFKLIVCGRRWGKDYLFAGELIKDAIAGGICWWIWPTNDYAIPGWRFLNQLIEPVLEYGVEVTKAPRCIYFPGGGEIRMKSAHKGDKMRGEGLKCVAASEIDYIPNFLNMWDYELRAALADMQGRGLFNTTPNGKGGSAYELYGRTITMDEMERSEWTFYNHPTRDNPHIAREELEKIKKTVSERVWRQEFEAEFLESGATWFTYVDRAMIVEPGNEPEEGKEYRAGIDWGRKHDRTIVSIVECSESVVKQVEIEKIDSLTTGEQIRRVAEVLKYWNVEVAGCDTTGMGLSNTEILEEIAPFVECVYYSYTRPFKINMMNKLAEAYEFEKFYILKDEESKVEHDMMRPTYNEKTRNITINAAPGFFDDIVNANGLSYLVATEEYLLSYV